MTRWRFIRESLRHFRRIHIAVALGVAVATAVLTGALLVGDSVRGSLRELTLARLGRIDSALVTEHLFRAELADELAASDSFREYFLDAEPVLLLQGTVQSGSGTTARRASSVSIIGCRSGFWSLGAGGPASHLVENQIVLTKPIARELEVEAGDDVLVRLPTQRPVPADSPLGEKSETSRAARFRVSEVLPAEGIARFGLMPDQHAPQNAFLSLETLQKLIDSSGKVNSILVSTENAETAAGPRAHAALNQSLRPKLADYGIRVERLRHPTSAVQIVSDQLVLPEAIVDAAIKTFGKSRLQPVVTYLANTISTGEGDSRRSIPYSTITGVDSNAQLGPLFDESNQPILLGEGEIVLNGWAANDLEAQTGDTIKIEFYEPESSHGRLRERKPPAEFTLTAVVPLLTSDGAPSAAADPRLTPELPGVTDQQSINDWDLPFPLVETIRQVDEQYWDEWRTTPKAFVSLATAKRLWSSRWGTISLLRLPADEAPKGVAQIATQLENAIVPEVLGMSFLPVKQMGLEASSGTTPFDGLFLGFSFFLIAAALMLVALLFQLGVEQRARELGTLRALGIRRSVIASLLGREGFVVSALGSMLGVVLGIGYAWLMTYGLRTWWLAAIVTPFLELYVSPRSLMFGCLLGVIASWLTIRWSTRRLVRRSASTLLRNATDEVTNHPAVRHGGNRWWPVLRFLLVALVVTAITAGFTLQGEAQAGAFFMSGAMVLILLLAEIRRWMRRGRRSKSGERLSIGKLAMLNTTRNPGRSTLTMGLVGTASFIILATSAFRLETDEGGTGGFEILATSDQPIHFDLDTPEGRMELGFSDEADALMEDWRVFSLRVAGGEDASCLNLYRPTQPRVLGVPETLVARGGFVWSAVANAYADAPWRALNARLGKDTHDEPIVPVVLDANTATYSLHLAGVGSRFEIRDQVDRPFTLEVVGLLKNSVLQGNLLVSEQEFLRLFPDASGYQMLLLEYVREQNETLEAAQKQQVAQQLELTLGDTGFHAEDARKKLAGFLAVQNTYLSTFQSLGGLGLMLGTLGLAVVELRSVLERRAEFALMRAGGFRRARLAEMVVLENILLLGGGLAIGAIAALVALIPQWKPQSAQAPWPTLAVLLATIAAVGVVAGWLATRSALRAPIVPALRGD